MYKRIVGRGCKRSDTRLMLTTKKKEVIMTTITASEAFKSKQNFSEFMENAHPAIILSTLAGYPKADGKAIVTFAELTQNHETLLNHLGSDLIQNLPQAPFIVWIVANERENILNAVKTINKHAVKGFGVFVFKAFLNEDKIDFECLLKPELKAKQTRNNETPAKLLQKAYWEKYFGICDNLQSEMQVMPAPQHYQYISIGKKGVQIVQTVNTKDKYIATELFINNDKEIFNKLYKHKDEIEAEIGFLDWQLLEGKKSSRIRRTAGYDIANPEHVEIAIKEHIKMAEELRGTFKKYL